MPRHAYTGHLPAPHTTSTLVRISDPEGATGLGQFDSDSYGDFDLAPFETLRTIVPRLIGRDPLEREAIWDAIRDHGTAPDLPGVRSAIDIALWDLVGHRADLPLHRMLDPEGGERRGLPAYASVPTLANPEAYADELARLIDAGYPAAKIHAWGDPERDVAALEAARSASDAMTLMYDAEGMLERTAAMAVIPALDALSIRWFEAPLPDLDLEGYRALRRGGRVPILPAGDSIWDPRLMREVLRDDPPWDAMRFDVTFAGGITSAIRLFEVAADHGMEVELTSYGQTLVQAANLHVALAFGRTTYFERAVPPEEFGFGVTTPIEIEGDGNVIPPDGPGLGIELDEEAVSSATLARLVVDRSTLG